MTLVLALDLATVSGFAVGQLGAAPCCGSKRLASKGASHAAIFGNAIEWLIEFTREHKPNVVAIEAPLSLGAIAKSRRGGWGRAQNADTNLLLNGLIAIAMGVAYARGIYNINLHPVTAIRSHFIDMNVCARGEAKLYTIRKCRSLGWLEEADDDAADAAALWSLQCSLLDPRQALRVSPLFLRGVAV